MTFNKLANNLNEEYNDNVKIEIECTEVAAESILKLLEYLKHCGQIGHSVDFKIDDTTFGFDGDGADKISFIKLDGKTYRSDKWI